MDNQFLDHGNIASLKYLFRTFSREGITTMKQLKLSEQDIPRFPPLSTLSVFTSVELLDMRKCGLSDFPGALITKGMPTLQTVDLTYNRLRDVSGLLPLGQLKKLRDLRLEGNPMPYIELRTVLLEKLLYPEKLVHLKMVRIYTGTYRHPDLSLLRKSDSEAVLKKTMTLSLLLAKKQKPAPVPRTGTFPMLEFLNGGRITVEELESAKPYPDADIFCSPQHPRPLSPTRKLAPIHRSIPSKKSSYPCLVRNPQVEPTTRWLQVQPIVLNASLFHQTREKAVTTRPDRSYEASFIREDDSNQASSSEGEDWPEETWISEPVLPRGKTFAGGLDPLSPRSDQVSNLSRLATLPSQRDLSKNW